MYEKFYGFKNSPFNLTPDSDFFYSSPRHEEALNRLAVSISERNGFTVITGDIGSGKTTVCRKLLREIDPATKIALILNTHLGKKELLTTILEDLEIEYKSTSKTHILSALNKYLIEQAAKDVTVVLLIDEAQNLTPTVLEEVRMLSNLETEKEKLLQIILVGQPELRKKLSHPKLRQFSQRIVMYYHLGPLDRVETTGYIKHRLNIARYEREEELFPEETIDDIYNYSQGIPRLINLVCHNSLIGGFLYEFRTISKDIAKDAIDELMYNKAYKSTGRTDANISDEEQIVVNSNNIMPLTFNRV
ncbi:MAG: AAA family ATPase [Candidatus Omnitrophota bacterium]